MSQQQLMRGAAEILARFYDDLAVLSDLLDAIERHERKARDVARIDPIRVELWLDKNPDPIRDARDTLTQLRRLLEEDLRPKLQRRAALDKASDDTLTEQINTLVAEVAALKAWRADVERGTLRIVPHQRKEETG